MSEIVRQLEQEHVQLNRVLDLLVGELAIFRSGEVPDYQLVQEIVDYCLDYPESCHRPTEDAIHAMLIRRAPELGPAVADLPAAHRRMAKLTRRLNDTVERVVRDETMSRDRFIDIIESFIDGYRAHMRAEEEELFPQALQWLDAADWAALRARLDGRRDPLFGHTEASRFATLRNGILRSA